MPYVMESRSESFRRIRAATDAIEVGRVYFLSSFWDKDGAMVRVLDKSYHINRAGWPSTVEYEVVEPVGIGNERLYAVGATGTCNATNLYETREDASVANRGKRQR